MVAKNAFENSSAGKLKLQSQFTKSLKNSINKLLLAVVNSMGCDSNYSEDNNTVIILSGSVEESSNFYTGCFQDLRKILDCFEK